MPMIKILQEAKKLEIQPFKRPKHITDLKEENVPFSGSPLRHPYDDTKIILLVDPYSNNTFYYEFKADDISFVEELPSVVSMEGENINMARVWIRKRRVGIRCTPFVVDDIKRVQR
jgi:hypothetical protein